MRPLLFVALLLLCSCASGKPQYIPPPKPIEPKPVVLPETREPEKTEPTKPVEQIAEDSFLAVLLREGTPSENIIPRSKEQVAVYRKDSLVSFYYFRRNQLIKRKDYPVAEIEQLQASGSYPEQILRELGAK